MYTSRIICIFSSRLFSKLRNFSSPPPCLSWQLETPAATAQQLSTSSRPVSLLKRASHNSRSFGCDAAVGIVVVVSLVITFTWNHIIGGQNMFRPFGVHLEGMSQKRKVVTSVHKCLQGILVGGLCPSSEDVADCEANPSSCECRHKARASPVDSHGWHRCSPWNGDLF